MNTTSSAFPSVSTSVVDIQIQPTSALRSYKEPPFSGGDFKRAEPVEHHMMSPIPKGVSFPDMLLFILRRLTHQGSDPEDLESAFPTSLPFS
jgi:hypothetical protein